MEERYVSNQPAALLNVKFEGLMKSQEMSLLVMSALSWHLGPNVVGAESGLSSLQLLVAL